MLFLGRVDLHIKAAGGQFGGSLAVNMWLLPETGDRYWDSLAKDNRGGDGLPWLAFTMPSRDFAVSWIGHASAFGRNVAAANLDVEVELGRVQANYAKPAMHLYTVITQSPIMSHSRPFRESLSFDVTIPEDVFNHIQVATDLSLEQQIEYCTTVMEFPPPELQRWNREYLGEWNRYMESTTKIEDV